MPGPASTVLLTVTGLEALVLASRLPSRRGRTEHVRLLLLVLALVADEICPAGLLGCLCVLAVAAAQGNVLAPRHRLTTVQNLVALVAAALLSVLALMGVPLGPATIALLVILEGFTLAQMWLERHWMGGWVFAALTASGAIWLGGRILGLIEVGPVIPAPGLPLSLALIPAVPAWWFAPDGPHVSRWRRRAAGLEGRLEQAEARIEAQSALTALGFVAAGAAHEFRSALAGIGGLAGWARENPAVAVKNEALESIRSRVEDAHRAVVPLLEQISGGDRSAPGVLDLSRELHPLVAFVRATIRRDGVALQYEPEGPATVTVRRSEIEHVLINLLRNAAEAARRKHPAPSTIQVRVRCSEAEVCVEVEDDAGGIEPGRAALLFRAESTRGGGSGVGLFIARGLAERNGGTLEYLPRAGGSLFRLRLPAVRPNGGGPNGGGPNGGGPNG